MLFVPLLLWRRSARKFILGGIFFARYTVCHSSEWMKLFAGRYVHRAITIVNRTRQKRDAPPGSWRFRHHRLLLKSAQEKIPQIQIQYVYRVLKNSEYRSFYPVSYGVPVELRFVPHGGSQAHRWCIKGGTLSSGRCLYDCVVQTLPQERRFI